MRIAPLLYFTCLSLVILPSCHKKEEGESDRSFHMGVTPWPADFTTEELDSAYLFVRDHCDLVSQHFDDGIPWEECRASSALPAALQDDLNFRKNKTPPGTAVLLSVSALDLSRKARAGYYPRSTLADSIKNTWTLLRFDDPEVIGAYVNFVSRLIDFFQPTYVNYGVESNFAGWAGAEFNLYKQFLAAVYARLKAQYPSLPFMVSFMVDESSAGWNYAKELLAVTDYVSLSAYPYTHISSSAGGSTDPGLFPAGYFERFADLDPSRPLAIAETGYIAENLQISSMSLNKQGTEEWQSAYLEKILHLCEQRKARFLIWFCHKDYDAGDNRLRGLGLYQDLFGIWEDTGLKNEVGVPRKAWYTWMSWMSRRRMGD